jgi:hypothetical protein
MSLRSMVATGAVIAIYLAVMASTNHLFTILDDEATIVALAGHPAWTTLTLFLKGGSQNEHPPFSDILLHFWLAATHYSFFFLRIFANLFFSAGVFFCALAAKRSSGEKPYWTALLVGCLWPFAFQYGRITGWYAVCMFFVSALTWIYVRILEESKTWLWVGFGIGGVLLVWSNYFGVVILLCFLMDYLVSHWKEASKNLKSLLLVMGVIAVCFLPLLRTVLLNIQWTASDPGAGGLKEMVAGFSFSLFSIFASVAVAPWYLPLCIPVFAGTALLILAIWFSPGRRWFLYFMAAMIVLQLSGHMSVKRVSFLLPWLLVAMALAAASARAHFPGIAAAALALLILIGWAGIASGKHYATTNLYEPWDRVAQVVAGNAQRGETVVSENIPFFFYLNYRLSLESETSAAQGSYLGQSIYAAHGYKILQPADWQSWAQEPHGKIVLVNGSAQREDVQAENALNDHMRSHCKIIGIYRAAPDPAAAWKQRYVRDAPVLFYRVDVTWYDCSNNDNPTGSWHVGR